MANNISISVEIWPSVSPDYDKYYGKLRCNGVPFAHAWSYSEAVRSTYLKFKMGYAEKHFR